MTQAGKASTPYRPLLTTNELSGIKRIVNSQTASRLAAAITNYDVKSPMHMSRKEYAFTLIRDALDDLEASR